MSAVTCEGCRGLLLGAADAASRHDGVAAHLESCPDCRTLAEALEGGAAAWLAEDAAAFAARVVAHTSAADALAAELRDLAEMDPGPGFTERILQHTTRRPAPARWRAQWAAGLRALVRRPRFAWEVAYAGTLCLVLALGNPVSALEWGSQRVVSIAQDRLGRPASTLRQDLERWRATFAADTPGAAGASSPAAGTPQEPQGAFEAAWQSASTWVRSQLGQMVVALLDMWTQVTSWIAGTAAEPPAPTEPRRDAARSPQ